MTILSTDNRSLVDYVGTLETSIIIKPFEMAHLKQLNVRDELSYLTLDDEETKDLAKNPELCATLYDRSGEILACMGVFDKEGLAYSWAVNGVGFAKNYKAITNIVNMFFKELGVRGLYEKVYGSVLSSWKQGHNWLSMIEFTPLPDKFMISGREFTLYERNLI